MRDLITETYLEIPIYSKNHVNQDHIHRFSHPLEAFLLVHLPLMMCAVCQNGWTTVKEEEFEQYDQKDWP